MALKPQGMSFLAWLSLFVSVGSVITSVNDQNATGLTVVGGLLALFIAMFAIAGGGLPRRGVVAVVIAVAAAVLTAAWNTLPFWM